LVDKDLTISFNGDTKLDTDTTILTNLLAGSGGVNQSYTFLSSSGTSDVVLNPYRSSSNYSGQDGELILIHPTATDAGLYQNMVTWGGPQIDFQSVPEPSSLALSGLGALALIGYALRRRSRA
jgi:hypothetical protein